MKSKPQRHFDSFAHLGTFLLVTRRRRTTPKETF